MAVDTVTVNGWMVNRSFDIGRIDQTSTGKRISMTPAVNRLMKTLA